MNTANLQMEGVLLALTALCDQLKQKQLLTPEELRTALDRAERGVSARSKDLSDANREAIRFPILFLRLALEQEDGALDYNATVARVGRLRDSVSSANGRDVDPAD